MASVAFNSATAMNVSILQTTNSLFQTSQKRVSTGKWVFGAADDATRYKMSETMLGRARQLDALNNNVSLGLKTLEATDQTLKQMIGLVESAQELARKAQAEGAGGIRGIFSGVNIGSATVIAGYAVGAQLSITSDGGQNFTYTFTKTGTTWGEVADALNSANIGVMAEFIPGTAANTTNIRFFSTNDKDFRFDGASTETIMDDLVNATMVSPTGGQTMTAAVQAQNLFANAGVAPTATETGFTVSFGGAQVGVKTGLTGATAVAANSLLVFEDGNGQTRTLNYTVATTVATVINDINNLNAGIRAELFSAGATATPSLRIRNTNGGNATITAATGAFAAAGAIGFTPGTAYAAPLSVNNALRLQYGRQYDAIITNLNLLAINNPVQTGRNLLQGENLAVVMDEFGGNPITVAGIKITANGTLTMAQAGTTWTTDANIQTSATQSNSALLNLRNFQAQFATFNSYMQDRYDLNKSYQTDLKTTGDDLVAADVAEESAKLTALQTQQQFAVQAFSMGTQNAQSLLRLLG
jgi:flagellin